MEDLPVHNDQEAAHVFQTMLHAAFYSSNWKTANMSENMKKFLNQPLPVEGDFLRIFTSPSESSNPDLNCTPRGP